MDYKGMHTSWTMLSQPHMKEQNTLPINKKFLTIIAERDAAIYERNMALNEKKQACAERDAALQQRDEAIAERNKAQMERDNAIAALQYNNRQYGFGPPRSKYMEHPINHPADSSETPYYTTDMHLAEPSPLSIITSEALRSHGSKQMKGKREDSPKASKSIQKKKKASKDLNRQICNGIKIKSEWDSQELGLNLVTFDESTMSVPVCSCTGVPRPCYKGGNGGWQSSCCTNTMSVYPLPQMPNRRYNRIGGRKMSGSVFTRLLTRAVAAGHDVSVPLDLKDYWARHGTNRYIIIK